MSGASYDFAAMTVGGFAARLAEKVPALHLAQLVAPAAEYAPATQAAQVGAPGAALLAGVAGRARRHTSCRRA
jgi:hypothetical protein